MAGLLLASACGSESESGSDAESDDGSGPAVKVGCHLDVSDVVDSLPNVPGLELGDGKEGDEAERVCVYKGAIERESGDKTDIAVRVGLVSDADGDRYIAIYKDSKDAAASMPSTLKSEKMDAFAGFDPLVSGPDVAVGRDRKGFWVFAEVDTTYPGKFNFAALEILEAHVAAAS